jgi:hypothetical protein
MAVGSSTLEILAPSYGRTERAKSTVLDFKLSTAVQASAYEVDYFEAVAFF